MPDERMVIVACPKCGQKLRCVAGGVGTCPKCGTRLTFPDPLAATPDIMDAHPEPSSATVVENRSKKKAAIIALILVVVLAAGSFFLYNYYREQEYLDTIQNVLSSAHNAYTSFDSISGLAVAVWNDSVFRNERSGTSQYVYYGGYHHDVDESLRRFFDDSTVSEAISVSDLFARLSKFFVDNIGTPPNKYKDLHDKAIALTDYVSQYNELTQTPSGMNLPTYTERRSELSSACESAYQALKQSAPEPNESFLSIMDKIMFWKNSADEPLDESALQ